MYAKVAVDTVTPTSLLVHIVPTARQESMMTRTRIRNPVAYNKANEKRQRRQQKLIEAIAKRLGPILRNKHNGTLIAPCIEIVWIEFAQGGGISPNDEQDAQCLKINPQIVMKKALELAVERGEINLSVMDSGEVVLSVWPPVDHVVVEEDPEARKERYLDMARGRIPEHLLREWLVV